MYKAQSYSLLKLQKVQQVTHESFIDQFFLNQFFEMQFSNIYLEEYEITY